MSNKCYAAIDIGSNAVRLLIKKEKEDENLISKRLSKVMLLRVPLRLGFDVFSLGEVSEIKLVKLRRLMKAFRQLMKIYEVTDYRACATSAMRDAKNGKSVIKKILKDTGINIEVIDGQEEAHMIYNNHIECMEDRTGNYIYVDVGGGSTEINLLTNGELVQSLSYNIGTVRILSGAVKDETWAQMKDDLTRLTADFQGINIIGSGGNINKLYRLAEKKDKKKMRMPIASLQGLYDELKPLTPEQRMNEFSLKADRADVIVPAAEIFLTIANIVKAEYIHVPVIGLADGIIDSLYSKQLSKE
ncbi:Ppx/GppA family phosphatase [Bacteroides sp. ET489]|jgi:exopolyphosphatase/guanosine-5'-triphosphate,3'-diphosphate pyrophosphatase|uniref:Ppx/GppA phosphatase family protein n=1 Tax=Bacteroides TaxID=816 RepID=UPI000336CC38|nr:MULTISPECIES: ppx/GppA phosphatase [Bacteroides]MDO3389924.1 Ppx/GppA family phosphatase [Bacteroides sp. ET489]CDB10563.1 ppx/GppA phosphatase [Bacteroides sp. CAG:633]